MRHHFGDFLDRGGDYWSVVPNRERYAYRIADVESGSADVHVMTIGRNDEDWQKVLTLPQLQELTLHEPNAEQLQSLTELPGLQRLRITHARPRTLEFLCACRQLRELVLEYVSGVADLGPLGALPHLRALHLENLRKVSSFDGLSGASGLRYLAIHGTVDWQQPVADFQFLNGLSQLEVFRLWQVVCRAEYPATLPFRFLDRLQQLALHGSYLATAEYAMIEECLPGVAGAEWGAFRAVAHNWLDLPAEDPRMQLSVADLQEQHPEVRVVYDGRRQIEDPASRWFEFTGRGAGRVKCSSPQAAAKCGEREAAYLELRRQAAALLQ